jgi:hypothetical protein
MVKRLAFVLFLLFYTASVVGLTVDRTQTWASDHSRDSKLSRSENGVRISDWHKRSPHHRQTKLLEDASGLVSPFVRTYDPPYSETAVAHLLSDFVVGQSGNVVSLRAPPVISL